MHKYKKLYLALFIVLSIISVCSFVFVFVCSLIPGVIFVSMTAPKEYYEALVSLNKGTFVISTGVILIVAVIGLLASAFAALFLARFYALSEDIKTLHVENLYNFGFESLFYNYPLFKNRVKKLVNKHHRKGNYLVAFSTCKKTVSRNLYRDNEIMQLNGLLSKYLDERLSNIEKFPLSEFAYCYYHGQFVIYTFIPLHDIQDLINDIQTKIYDIVKDQDLKVHAQPYFGVAKVVGNKNLLELLDDAITARDHSESKFENETFYDDKLRKNASSKQVEELRQAIRHNEMVVYYQPKFHLEEKKFIGSEALVRWNSPKYGLLSPARFLDKAELSGLIHELDMFVLHKVCEDLSATRRKGERMLPVSINFSMYEFFSPEFFDNIKKAIYKWSIAPELIQIEVTETTAQANPFLTSSILKKLKDYGFKILMDDFGQGYSNLGNLNRMAFDTVKIDKSFVDGIISDSKTRDIVKFLISLCKINNLDVIAEGVDKIEQVEILKKFKCDAIQGYFYSKPLPFNEYLEFLNNNKFEKKEEAE